jgi:hypothetical protein
VSTLRRRAAKKKLLVRRQRCRGVRAEHAKGQHGGSRETQIAAGIGAIAADRPVIELQPFPSELQVRRVPGRLRTLARVEGHIGTPARERLASADALKEARFGITEGHIAQRS